MAVAPRTIHVPAGLPIDEATRFELLDAGKANLANENVRADSPGSLGKRLGFASLSSARIDSTTRSTGDALFQFGEQTCVIADAQLDGYSSTAATNIPRARLPECLAKTKKLVATPDAASASTSITKDSNIVYVNGYYVVAYAEYSTSSAGKVVAHVVDATTGAVVLPQQLVAGLGNDISIRVVAVGTDVVVFYRNGDTDANISGHRLSVASAASVYAGFGSQVNVVTNAETIIGQAWDACGLTTSAVVTWVNDTGGTTRVSTRRVDSTVNALTTLTTATSATLNAQTVAVACDGDEADILWVAFTHDGSQNIYVEGRNPTTLAITATQAAVFTSTSNSPGVLSLGRTATQEGYIAWQCTSSTASAGRDMEVGKIAVSGGAAAASGTKMTYAAWAPQSRPFTQGSRVYMEVTYYVGTEEVCLVDITTPSTYRTLRPIAWTKPRLQASRRQQNMAARPVARVSSTKVATLQFIKSSTINGYASACEYDFIAKRFKATQFGQCVALQTGVPYLFDKQQAHEIGFIVAPYLRASASGAAGITGTYAYTAVFEYVDAAGNIHYSETSPAISVTTTGAQTINVTIGTCSATWKDGADNPREPNQLHRIRIRLYRTTNGGSTFYLHTTFIAVPGTPFHTTADTTADANISSNAQCYRHPGVLGTALARQCPPGFVDQCEYNGMLVGIEGENVWHSAAHVVGEAPWFNEVWQYPVSGDGDNIAVAAMDGTLFVFKRRAIYAMSGEAPSDSGSAGGLGAPRRLAVDVGCIDPRSVVVTSLGIFFQSDRGIELLTRAQSVDPIGEAIQSTLSSYPIVSSAVLDTKHGLVRISLAASESASTGRVSGTGRDVVYDLTRKGWISVDKKSQSTATPSQAAAMLLVDGSWRYGWLGADGTLYYEKLATDATAYCDGSTFNVSKYELAPVKFGLQQEQRVYEGEFLFERHTDCALKIEVANDFAAYSAADDKDWTYTQVATASRQVPFRTKPRTSGFRLRVSDSAAGTLGTGKGLTFVGFSFDITPETGMSRSTTRVAPSLRK